MLRNKKILILGARGFVGKNLLSKINLLENSVTIISRENFSTKAKIIIGDLTVDVLIVTGTGNVEGNVRARSVTIEGKLNGTIAAINVSLASTAILSGKVVAQKIEINSGANVEAELRATGKADTKALS